MTDIRDRLRDGEIGPAMQEAIDEHITKHVNPDLYYKRKTERDTEENSWTIHIPKSIALYGSCFVGGAIAGWLAVRGVKVSIPVNAPVEKIVEAAAEIIPDVSTTINRVKGGNDVIDITAQQYHATQKALAASAGVSESTVSHALHETGRGMVAGHDIVRLHTSPELTNI